MSRAYRSGEMNRGRGRLPSPPVDPRAVLRLIAAGRTLLGVVALTRPELPARPWVGREDAGSTGGRVLARALGTRDLVLGAGALAALRTEKAGRDWAVAGSVADALDAIVTLGAFRRLPKGGRLLVLASAGGAAAIGWINSQRLGDG